MGVSFTQSRVASAFDTKFVDRTLLETVKGPPPSSCNMHLDGKEATGLHGFISGLVQTNKHHSASAVVGYPKATLAGAP